jgi:hypothetical protein
MIIFYLKISTGQKNMVDVGFIYQTNFFLGSISVPPREPEDPDRFVIIYMYTVYYYYFLSFFCDQIILWYKHLKNAQVIDTKQILSAKIYK